MTPLAISTGLAALAIIGLIIGLVVLGVVVKLLAAVLSPLREISRHAREAPRVAPFITNGVQGVDELRRSRELSSQVPPLALAYLAKVTAGSPAAETPAAPPYSPPPAADPAGAPSASPSPRRQGLQGLISGGKP